MLFNQLFYFLCNIKALPFTRKNIIKAVKIETLNSPEQFNTKKRVNLNYKDIYQIDQQENNLYCMLLELAL